MLDITQNQMNTMADYLDEQFIIKMASYIRSCTGKQAEAATMEELKKEVRYLIDRAKEYGYTNQKDVYYFIEIILMCGNDFENDSQYDWLTSNLLRNTPPKVAPIKQLYDAAKRNRLKENVDIL